MSPPQQPSSGAQQPPPRPPQSIKQEEESCSKAVFKQMPSMACGVPAALQSAEDQGLDRCESSKSSVLDAVWTACVGPEVAEWPWEALAEAGHPVDLTRSLMTMQFDVGPFTKRRNACSEKFFDTAAGVCGHKATEKLRTTEEAAGPETVSKWKGSILRWLDYEHKAGRLRSLRFDPSEDSLADFCARWHEERRLFLALVRVVQEIAAPKSKERGDADAYITMLDPALKTMKDEGWFPTLRDALRPTGLPGGLGPVRRPEEKREALVKAWRPIVRKVVSENYDRIIQSVGKLEMKRTGKGIAEERGDPIPELYAALGDLMRPWVEPVLQITTRIGVVGKDDSGDEEWLAVPSVAVMQSPGPGDKSINIPVVSAVLLSLVTGANVWRGEACLRFEDESADTLVGCRDKMLAVRGLSEEDSKRITRLFDALLANSPEAEKKEPSSSGDDTEGGGSSGDTERPERRESSASSTTATETEPTATGSESD